LTGENPASRNALQFSDLIEHIDAILAILTLAHNAIRHVRRNAGLMRLLEGSLIIGTIVGTGFRLATYGIFMHVQTGFTLATDSTATSAYPSIDSMTATYAVMIAVLMAAPTVTFGSPFVEKTVERLRLRNSKRASNFGV
jgi:hypothetical protein